MVIVLDGLDECDDPSIQTVLTLIRSRVSSTQSSITSPSSATPTFYAIKWLIVSRRDDVIHEMLDGSAQIDLGLNEHHVSLAVEEYIAMQVSLLARKKKYDLVLQEKVRQALLQKAEGTFLWVSLACAQLAKPGVKAMHTARMISDLPSGLTPLYKTILDDVLRRVEDIVEDDRQYVACILRAMSVAFRPLTILELGVVVDLPDDYRADRSALEEFVRLCGGLVEVRQDTVHFVHSSVKAFLFTTTGILSPTQDEDHFWMASNCIYSLVTTFHESTKQGLNPTMNRTLPFLDYPAVFWSRHARNAPREFFLSLHQGSNWWAADSSFRDAWFSYHWGATHSLFDAAPLAMSALLIAAYASVPALVQLIIERSDPSAIEYSDASGNTALMWSARGGDSQSVDLLVANGASVNTANQKHETPLHFAAFHGDHSVADPLIASGARLDFQDRVGWTALHRAAFGGHTTMVEKLLFAGAETDTKDQYSWTALQRSASIGNVDILRTLANHGADVAVKDREGMTPLSTASWNGHVGAIEELLDRGAKIEARDYEGWTALHHACWNGREECTKVLIEKGANVNALNHERASPLFQAAWSGHADIAQILLDRAAEVNRACDGGETPLQQAAWTGHADIVEILIKAGAEVNMVNEEGLSALHQASVNGQDDVVELLLEAGADPNLQNADGQTAYDQAQENTYASTALVLLERGSPRPSLSSSNSEHELGELDSAIAKLLSTDPAQSVVQRHGHACSSKSWKVTVGEGSELISYFLKTGPNINMFAGKYIDDCY